MKKKQKKSFTAKTRFLGDATSFSRLWCLGTARKLSD